MMSTKKYRIRLTTDEQQELNALVSRGRAAAYKQTHARILLMSDESRSDGGMKDADITSALGVGQSTVERIRKRCVEEGVESALNRKKQLRRRQKRLDGEGEARLIAMACGEPPEGRATVRHVCLWRAARPVPRASPHIPATRDRDRRQLVPNESPLRPS